ncbi:hypothetical protein ACVWXM_006987 [Bradyrhizobium sp. GM7.3]
MCGIGLKGQVAKFVDDQELWLGELRGLAKQQRRPAAALAVSRGRSSRPPRSVRLEPLQWERAMPKARPATEPLQQPAALSALGRQCHHSTTNSAAAGGVCSSGEINLGGAPSMGGLVFPGPAAFSGNGGRNAYGGGGAGLNNGTGQAGPGYGAGGGGAANFISQPARQGAPVRLASSSLPSSAINKRDHWLHYE